MSAQRRIVYAMIFTVFCVIHLLSAGISIELGFKHYREVKDITGESDWDYFLRFLPLLEKIIFGIVSALSALWILQKKATGRQVIVIYSAIMLLLWLTRIGPEMPQIFAAGDWLSLSFSLVGFAWWTNVILIFNSLQIKEQFVS